MIEFSDDPGSTDLVSFSDTHAAEAARLAAEHLSTSGWVVNGPEVSAFEAEFADFVGARNAVAVSSGTTGVELCLLSLHLPRHARVLVSTNASRGVLNSILRAGLRPALMDVSPDTGKPTTASVGTAARRDEAQGVPPAAVVLDHWSGDPTDVEELAAVAGLAESATIQDAAEALGSSTNAHHVGAHGTACFSFYSTSNLPVGEGGMITTDIEDRAKWLREARRQQPSASARRRSLIASSSRYGSREGGLAATMNDRTAAIGRRLLWQVELAQRRRRALALSYSTRLTGIPGIRLPASPSTGGSHSWHAYPVLVDPGHARAEVVLALRDAGIATGEPSVPLHQERYFRTRCEFPSDGLPGAERHAAELVLLPIYPRLPDDVADRVWDALFAVLGNGRGTGTPTAPG